MNKPSLEISVLVVSFNTRELTLAALRTLHANTVASYETIVVDNASSDGSEHAIEAEFPNVKLIRSDKNLGFAKANNIAATYASGQYILLLNPDTEVLDGAVDKLLTFAKLNPNAGIWGGRTVFSDGALNPASCWARQTWWSLISQALGLSSLFRKSSIFNPEGLGGWDREGIREVDIVSGCFLLIRRELWESLEGFKSEYFMYGEEADLCLRARSFGASPIVTSKATIVHHGGASERVRADKLVRLLKAKTLLVRSHFSASTVKLGVILLSAWPLSRYIAHRVLKVLGRRNSDESVMVWSEVWDRRKEWLHEDVKRKL